MRLHPHATFNFFFLVNLVLPVDLVSGCLTSEESGMLDLVPTPCKCIHMCDSLIPRPQPRSSSLGMRFYTTVVWCLYVCILYNGSLLNGHPSTANTHNIMDNSNFPSIKISWLICLCCREFDDSCNSH